MQFDLSKPQQLLQQAARDFCKREFPIDRVRALMETDAAMDDELWSKIVEQGWIGMHLDEQLGGLELGLVDLAVVAEELGRACAPGPWLSTNWAATLLAASGADAAGQYCPQLVDGSMQAAVAAFEEGGTWQLDPHSLRTRLEHNGQVLTGCKQLVLHARHADIILCVARRDEDLSLLVVPAAADGLTITPTPGIDATRKLFQCRFDNVRVQPDQILGHGRQVQASWDQAQRVATVAVCAEMLGLMQWMLDTTVEYAKTRRQFDRVIGSFQAIQHKCADMLLLAESARSAAWYAAWSLQEMHHDADRAIAVAKVYASDAVREVGNLAVQVHGGIGFTWEHDLHLYYRRAKANEYLFGDASFYREQLAKMIFA